MRSHRIIAIAATLALAVAACGDDAVTTTATATTATIATTAASSTTQAATTLPTTTTTTVPTTTTLPGDLHPAWGISWSTMWGAVEPQTGHYRTQIMGGESVELAANFEFGVPWRGGTWDRLVLGTVEPGQYGAALYFSRPEPWVLRLWGVAQTSPDRDDTVYEYFEVPQDLDLSLLPGNPPPIEGSMLVEHGFGTFGPTPAMFRVEWVGVETLEVGLGEMATLETYHLRFGLGGDFYPAGPGGEIEFFSDLWLHPEQMIVKWEPGPAGGPIELSIPWAAAGGG
ncbi:MAG: hypothetical protein MUE66_00415 [Acidimicrobiia bacterium]|nr:hypothetical protein [Acidimicrobiia bacterium]